MPAESAFSLFETSVYTFTGSYRIAKTTLDKLQKAFKSLCEAWLYLVFCEVCTENPELINDLSEDN